MIYLVPNFMTLSIFPHFFTFFCPKNPSSTAILQLGAPWNVVPILDERSQHDWPGADETLHPPKFRTAAASPQHTSTKSPAIFDFHMKSFWGVVGYRKFNSFGGWTFSLKLNPCTDWFKLVVLGCFLGYVAGNLSNRSQSNWKNHPLKGAGSPWGEPWRDAPPEN